ncbi:hypothetical protein D6D01_09505 [Aureobasidium pullulans]|uniref:Uncharacterized protein n=1 Tax=Aureobasidium pullulans TaxID=5580 RepID=A0A4S9K3H3_AURPU|nr:hypothetical protein D6D01_09505 [Aureobasidium pullulans]
MPVTRSKRLRDGRFHGSTQSTPYPHSPTDIGSKSGNLKSRTETSIPSQYAEYGGICNWPNFCPATCEKTVALSLSNLTLPGPHEQLPVLRDLPRELWGIIGQHLSSSKDLAALCLINQNSRTGALTHLYRRTLITNNERELHIVENLCSPENVGLRYIRHLTVAPSIEKVRPPGTKRFSKSRAKTLEHDVISKILATVPYMPLLQSIALCNNFYDCTNLTNQGLKPRRQYYVRELIPQGFYEHGCCFGHNSDTWIPRYWIWGKHDKLECQEAEQKALFKSKLGFCWFEGVRDNHTLAWRICD